LAEALERLLTPLGLAFAPHDRRTISISSAAALAKSQVLEWYPLAALRANPQFPVEPEQQLPWINEQLAARGNTSPLAAEQLSWDNRSKTLVVRANPAQHRSLSAVLYPTLNQAARGQR